MRVTVRVRAGHTGRAVTHARGGGALDALQLVEHVAQVLVRVLVRARDRARVRVRVRVRVGVWVRVQVQG